jgi:large conductance mechanosensitive channel
LENKKEVHSLWNEFRKFIDRGNVLDLAIGVVVGGAFGKIVTSFVDDILMPPIGLIIGKVDFSNLFINLSSTPYSSVEEAKKAGAATINYGLFLTNVINFLIIAFVIFLIVKQVNKYIPKKHEKPATSKECPICITSIPLQAKRCPACTSYLEELAEGSS